MRATDIFKHSRLALLENRIDDLMAKYRLLKSKREQLDKDFTAGRIGFVPRSRKEYEYEQRRRKQQDDKFFAMSPDQQSAWYKNWTATRDRRQKIANQITKRIVDLNHEIDVIKAEIYRAKHPGIKGEFAKYYTQKTGYKYQYLTELGRLIDKADNELPEDAQDAITAFIGHDPGTNEEGMVGFMNARPLEDAFSDRPSERGIRIRKELEAAFVPVKEALRKQFGDTVTLYRAQETIDGNAEHRHVLSWTGDLAFAEHLGRNLLTKTFPLDDIVWISDRANQMEFIMRNHK